MMVVLRGTFSPEDAFVDLLATGGWMADGRVSCHGVVACWTVGGTFSPDDSCVDLLARGESKSAVWRRWCGDGGLVMAVSVISGLGPGVCPVDGWAGAVSKPELDSSFPQACSHRPVPPNCLPSNNPRTQAIRC